MTIWKRKQKKTVQTQNEAAETDADAAVDTALETDAVEADTATAAPAEEIDWQARYNSEHEAFEKYRSEVRSADERRRKEEAYRNLLGECGIPERHRDKLTRLGGIDSLSLGDDGKIIGADELRAGIREEWRELIPKPSVPVASPPMYRGQALTKESIMAIKDRDARRAAIAQNPELFGY